MLAREKALYRGHAIAAVAATSQHIAEEAISLIEVEYDVLEPVLTAEAALAENAPVLHDRLLTQSSALFRVGGWGDSDEIRPSNLAVKVVSEEGDVKTALDNSDAVITRTFHTKPVHQGYIEPQATTALWLSLIHI